MRILIASPCADAWGYSKEAELNGVLLMASQAIFDMTGSGQIEQIVAAACKFRQVADAIVIDNHFVPKNILAISTFEMAFARKMQAFGIETFFLNNRNPYSENELNYTFRDRTQFYSELWRALKPMKIMGAQNSVPRTVKLGEFDQGMFNRKTGKVEELGGGDAAYRRAQHLVREGIAHWDHDWPKIIEAIAKELKLEPVAQTA